MTYDFLSTESAGNGRDDIIVLRQHPNWFERIRGSRTERVAFYGHEDTWHRMDGWKVNKELQQTLEDIWRRHRKGPKPPSASGRHSQAEDDDKVQEALEESFPASDPPAWSPSAL